MADVFEEKYRESSASAAGGTMAVDSSSAINWSVELEVGLFHAVHEHKPVGINRHFKMLFIHDKLNSTIKNKILVEDIWKHLGTLYDLHALNDSESLPFPNVETDFALPDELVNDLKDKPFPRLPTAAVAPESSRSSSDSGVEAAGDADGFRETSDPKSSSGHGHSLKHDKAASNDSMTSADKLYSQRASDSPARGDQRKRTRQSLNPAPMASPSAGQPAPSTAEHTTSSAKRSRRI